MLTFRHFFLKLSYFLMFVNIQIDLIILKTDDEQFTLTTKKKSLRITFKTTGKSQTHNSDNTCPSK